MSNSLGMWCRDRTLGGKCREAPQLLCPAPPLAGAQPGQNDTRPVRATKSVIIKRRALEFIKLNEMIIVFPSAPGTCIILWIYPWARKQVKPLQELMILRRAPHWPLPSRCVCLCPLHSLHYPQNMPHPLAAPIPPASGSYWSTSISCSYRFISSSYSYGSTSSSLESSASFCDHSWTWIVSPRTYMGFGLRTPSMVCGQSLNPSLSSVTKGQLPASDSSQNVCIMRIVLDLTEASLRCKSRQLNIDLR